MHKALIRKMDEAFYKNYRGNWDDDLFRTEVLKHLTTFTILLEVGAGAGRITQLNFKGMVSTVYGIDPDPRILVNPCLDHAVVGYGESMPFNNEQFDVIICNNVLEHLVDPVSFFREVNRVLKPEGVFITKTPNKHHYMPLIARLTPISFHKWYNRLRGREERDTFPTVYKANSLRSQTLMAQAAGFGAPHVLFYEGRPEYLRLNVATYCCGIIYERVINYLKLDKLKTLMITTFYKRK
jgi:ubiquinone/menaquinone biosynthesis C-methylase UbiE